jgi:hypothetical protein
VPGSGALFVSVAAVALGGCAQVLGIEDLHGGSGADGLTLSGTVSDLVSGDALPGITVKLHHDDGGAAPVIAMQPTGPGGDYEFAGVLPVPFDGFFELYGSGELHMFQHLLLPTDMDLAVPIQMTTMSDLIDLATASGAQQQVGNSFVVVEVIDPTNGHPIAGATVSSDPAGPATDVCYKNGPSTLDCSMTAATDASGRAVFFDVPELPTFTVAASTGGSASFPVLASTVVFTSVHP